MHILIAEDQLISRMILSDHLRKWGHQVTDVSNGKEALEVLFNCGSEIDMIITDWEMPIMDGISLAKVVREISATSHYIYIILLTGRNEFTDIVAGFSEGGVDDYIVKPFEVLELKLRIQGAIRLIKSERALRESNDNLERLVRKQTQDIRETQEEIISRLFNALESRDQETAQHVMRIAAMSSFMGGLLGWAPSRLDAIRAAAPLHDIGKIGIADSVLLKPDALTAEEFELIKGHTQIGAKILSGSHNPIIQMGEVIAHSHHENWDGTGYPKGLKENEIPIVAQVVSIVDVYDALSSDRVYRKGMPFDKVMAIISDSVGKKFSPGIGELFIKNIKDIQEHCETVNYSIAKREENSPD
ncbi:HD domain-containing phosphohydrolase [Desulfovibrio litoralis]|uniref:Putative two-component system response regulator n=1 Tax=Desulfovibrio litoralis DSM 11393 TaxID=1121455 RepID=A0A1M7SLJ4_9BACT|nr:HD domain-containing phosphohydrolase [Desulfovibrio litoralis]SHN59278.1 putative two-component system response regulator [Desulfovibrio litoralis DSM 11393]